MKPLVLTSTAQARRVKAVLDATRASCDVGARRERDPVGLVRPFTHRDDRELVGLLASSLAFGNVTIILAKVREVLSVLGPSPRETASRLPRLQRGLQGFVHRLFRGEDVARLLYGARRCQLRFGSLEALFLAGLEGGVDRAGPDEAREALARLVDHLRDEGGLPRTSPDGRRGPAHLLPAVRAGAGAKRLHLFLRWMVRPEDGVDLGVWSGVPRRLLACPVDTHILKLGRNLGLTARKDASDRTVREITASLARFDPEDPTKYDFSLCHLGMETRCRERFVRSVCGECPARGACRHVPRADSRDPHRQSMDFEAKTVRG
ncbi:MAG: TIGR02757 family protein [Myxococcales bacterium]|nr:TIGR02757 family protein [Myxococcales bacterium]